jgi:hypothetical protein
MKKHLLMIDEVLKKFNLCFLDVDDDDVNWCKRCYIELTNKSDIPSCHVVNDVASYANILPRKPDLRKMS